MWRTTIAAGALAGVLAVAVLGGCSLFKEKGQAADPGPGGSPPADAGQPAGNPGGSGGQAGAPALAEDLAAPLAAVENFMAARMRGEPVERFLADGGRTQKVRPSLSNPRLVGFDVAEGRLVDGVPTFVVRSYWRAANTAASVLTESITVGGAKTYAITGVDARGEVTAAVKDGAIHLRDEKGERKLAALAELPQVLRPREAAPGVEFGVSRDRVDAIALSPDGRTVAFCTGGVNGTLAVAGEGAALSALDIFPHSDCDALAWSADGRWLAVAVRSPAPSHALHVWQVRDRQARRVEPPGQMPEIARLRWTDGGFAFELKAEGRASDWMYRPDSGRLEPWKPVGVRG